MTEPTDFALDMLRQEPTETLRVFALGMIRAYARMDNLAEIKATFVALDELLAERRAERLSRTPEWLTAVTDD